MSTLGHGIATIDLLTLAWAGLHDRSETVRLQVRRGTEEFERHGIIPRRIAWDVLWE